jgi:parallel beta-helix repeat protein
MKQFAIPFAFALITTLVVAIYTSPAILRIGLNTPNQANAAGTPYYVDGLAGNDANIGSLDAPWRTLSKVSSSKFNPGDTIYLKRGSTWNEALSIPSSGNSTSPITIDAYGQGELPHIKATRLSPVSDWSATNNGFYRTRNALSHALVNGATGNEKRQLTNATKEADYFKNNYNGIADEDGYFYLRLTKQINQYNSPGIEVSNLNEPVRILNKQYIVIKNIRVTGSNTSNILIDNSDIAQKDSYVTITNVVSTGARYAGIYIKHASKNTVTNNEISDNAQEGVRVLTESSQLPGLGGNTITFNKIHGNVMPGVLLQGYSGASRAKGNIVKNNTIYDNGDGVYIRYTTENTVSNNTIYSNNKLDYAGEGDGIPIQSSSNNTVAENIIYGQRNAGIQLWGGTPTTANPKYGRSDGNKIIRNTIHSNKLGFLSSSNYSSNNTLAYNLIHSNREFGTSMGHPDNKGNLFHNNTITKNKGAIKFYSGAPSGWDIKNNIFSRNPTGIATAPEIDAFPDKFNNNNFDQDRVSGTNGNPRIADPNAVIGDPQFVNASANDFRLKNTSPLINKGLAIGYSSDINNSSILGLPDIGAFEQGSSSSTTPPPTPEPVNSPTPATPSPIKTPIPSTPATPTPVTTGLLGYWSLNDNGGPLAREFSGNNHWARLVNGASWTSAGYKTGSPAIRFDKTKNQYLSVDPTNAPNFKSPTANLTVMAWINPQLSTTSTTRFREGIISAFSNGGFRLTLNDSGNNLQFAYRNDPGTYYALTSSSPININAWQHVAATFNGATREVVLYINGVQSAKGTGTDSTIKSLNTIQIGVNLDNSSYFNGTIDEVKIYSRTLTAQEILSEKNK